MGKKENTFYVSNKALYQEYLVWYANIKEAEEEGIERPQIPNFIIESMLRIATRLSYKPNFLNYTFRDDMIGDALVDCVRFATKFNPNKSENPFSYITTICFNAFLRRIDREKVQKYIKAKIVTDFPTHEFLDNQEHEEDGAFVNQYIDFLRETGYSDDCVPMSIKRTKKIKELNAGPLAEFSGA